MGWVSNTWQWVKENPYTAAGIVVAGAATAVAATVASPVIATVAGAVAVQAAIYSGAEVLKGVNTAYNLSEKIGVSTDYANNAITVGSVAASLLAPGGLLVQGARLVNAVRAATVTAELAPAISTTATGVFKSVAGLIGRNPGKSILVAGAIITADQQLNDGRITEAALKTVGLGVPAPTKEQALGGDLAKKGAAIGHDEIEARRKALEADPARVPAAEEERIKKLPPEKRKEALAALEKVLPVRKPADTKVPDGVEEDISPGDGVNLRAHAPKAGDPYDALRIYKDRKADMPGAVKLKLPDGSIVPAARTPDNKGVQIAPIPPDKVLRPANVDDPTITVLDKDDKVIGAVPIQRGDLSKIREPAPVRAP